MNRIFPILPLVILAGMENVAWGQIGFGSRNAANQPRVASAPMPPGGAAPTAAPRAPATQPAAASAIPAGSPALASPAEVARQLLERAVIAQHRWRSVAARIRTEIHLFDQHLVGSGTYLQGSARDRAWRLELRVQTDAGVASLLQVCDGRQYWRFWESPEQRLLERIDAPRVFASLARYRPLSQQAPTTNLAIPTMGICVGGVPRLLYSLQESFEFRGANEAMLDRVPVWILQGSWKPAQLIHFLPEQRAAIEEGRGADLHQLPAQLPDGVTLFLGRDDLFPYRLEYHRRHPGKKEWEKESRKSRDTPRIKCEWFEVRFDMPVSREQFTYQPGDTQYQDVTDRYLEGLGLPLN